MKQLFKILFILLLFYGSGLAQNATKDASGNYHAVAKKEIAPKNTGKTFTDAKGIVYPVMTGAKGALFIVRTSKKGTQYRQYLKLQ